MPMRNLLSIIVAVAIGVWAYFGVVETLNKHSTTLELMEKDLSQNTEFRGDLGQSSGESELFMLVEHISGIVEDMGEEIKSMRNNAVNIEFLQKQVEKLQTTLEKVQEEHRTFKVANGNYK
jgi:siroheme synthase